jgi:signal transduction histidine kinase
VVTVTGKKFSFSNLIEYHKRTKIEFQFALDFNSRARSRKLWCTAVAWLSLTLCAAAFIASSTLIARADAATVDATSGAGVYNDPTNLLGSWIWETNVSDNQTCLLWKAFVIPVSSGITNSSGIINARFCVTADNEFTVFLDGRELGHGAEWRELFSFDLAPLLSPGRHVMVVKAFNSYSFAGMILGLQVDLTDGRRIEIKSDASWKIIPWQYLQGKGADSTSALTDANIIKNWKKIATAAAADWPTATVKAPGGGDPWSIMPQRINVMPAVLPIKIFFWQTGWFQALLVTVCLTAIATCLWLVAKLALQRKDQLLLQRERSRIARDIHDDLGSKITQLVLHGEVAQSELSVDAKLRSQLDLICQDTREVLSLLDEVLWAVNPKRDDLLDFTEYVCDYAEQFLKGTPIQCLLDVGPEAPALELNLPARRGLLMVTKEALNNAVKYSDATELWLQIHCEHTRLTLTLKDNGKGFDSTTMKQKRNGLLNMTDRMVELGGSCVVTSQPGKGCKIEFSVPLKQSRWQFWSNLRNGSGTIK